MNRFVIEYGERSFSFDIDYFKFLVGDNYDDKFAIYNVIKSTFNKVANSDYANERLQKHQMKFDDKNIDCKVWKFFEVTPFFDLESDLKIGSKSLVGKYLESLSSDIEQNEIFNTMSILVNSLNEEFFNNETVIPIKDKEFKLHLNDITKATILKEISTLIECDELECNSSDFDYEEIILFQLSLIERIAKSNAEKLIFVYCNIPFITNRIKTKILGLKYKGCFILIDTLKTIDINIGDVAICSKHFADFANRDLLLDKMMDFPFHIDLDELVSVSQSYISNKNNSERRNVLVELFPWEI